MRNILTLGTLVILASCGSEKKEKSSEQVRVTLTEQEAQKVASDLPQSVIIRVPVKADGTEDNTKVELRTLNIEAKSLSKDSVASNFEKAESPKSVVNELDSTTSQESFFGWGCYTCFGRGYGYGAGFGYRSYVAPAYGYGYGFGGGWNAYSPTYFAGGYNWGYSYAGGFYGAGLGYNYYAYGRGYGYGWGYGY